MRDYQVTLAQLAWIKGTVTVKANSWGEAFALAKSDAHNFRASWPIDDDGDTVVGFGDMEVDSGYCADEEEPTHDGEPPAADVLVYKAAPALLETLHAVRRRARNARGAIESNQVVDKDVHGSMDWIMDQIDAALRAAGAEV